MTPLFLKAMVTASPALTLTVAGANFMLSVPSTTITRPVGSAEAAWPQPASRTLAVSVNRTVDFTGLCESPGAAVGAPSVSGWLEQLDRVTGQVVEQNLLPARTGDHVVPEVHARRS